MRFENDTPQTQQTSLSQGVKTLDVGDHQRERSQSVSVCTLLVQWSKA